MKFVKKRLKERLRSDFSKAILWPLVIATLLFIVLFVSFREYLFLQAEEIETTKSKDRLVNILIEESEIIEHELNDVELYMLFLQKEHEMIFKYKDYNASDVSFDFAPNGVLYKTTKKGASVFYAPHKKIGKKELQKAYLTEAMDKSLAYVVNNNRLIVSAYFNSYDNMNRLYPYIEDVYKQFDPTSNIKKYNFYYLADQQHNPSRVPVWTDKYKDPAGKGWMLSCVAPIYNGDFLEGVSGLDITLQNITKVLLAKKLPFHAKMILLDKNGELIAKSKSVKNEDENFFNFLKKMIQNDLESTEYIGDEKAYVILNKKLSKIGAHLIIYTEKPNMLTTVHNIKEKVFLLVIIFAVAYFIIFFIMYKMAIKKFDEFSEYIARPISFLSTISSDIETYKKNISKFHTDITEVEELNKNFNALIEDLDHKNREIEAFNETLKKRITAAVKDLEDQNNKINTLRETVMEAVFIFNSKHNIVELNKVGQEMFEYGSDEDLVGKNIFDFVVEEEHYKVKQSLQLPETKPYELSLRKKDGEIFTALVKGSNITINDEVHRIVSVVDISDVKEKERQFLQQSKLVQMGDMVSMIAHQWRQPLNAISAASIKLSMKSEMGLLENDYLQETTVFIQQKTQEMSSIINTFMNFVKPSKTLQKFKFEHTLNEIMNIMGEQLKNHNIDVEILIQEKDIAIVGHEDLLEQVVINLLSNARDAFDTIKRNVKWIKIVISKENDVASICIEDNAGGIPSQIADKIFNPYFTTKAKGTGIGLYMSLEIMRKSFKGDLRYFATEEGSRFVLTFNRRHNNASEIEEVYHPKKIC